MNASWLTTAVGLVLLEIGAGCQGAGPIRGSALEEVSQANLERLLSSTLRIDDVLRRFGAPLLPVDRSRNYGGFAYQTADRRWISFSFLGDFIVEASFREPHRDSVSIRGQQPVVHEVQVGDDQEIIGRHASPMVPSATEPRTFESTLSFDVKHVPWYGLGKERFYSEEAFKKRLQALPRGSIVAYHIRDTFTGFPEPENPPLQTTESLEGFVKFCREIGLVLAVYPGG